MHSVTDPDGLMPAQREALNERLAEELREADERQRRKADEEINRKG